MFKALFGDPNARKIKKFQPIVSDINAFEEDILKLSDDELRGKTFEFRSQLDKVRNDNEMKNLLLDLLPEAYAVVREAGQRVLGMRHFDVQMLGGIVLHSGQIAEMKTGEGKTLVATLPSYLNAIAGRGVHVVTVNDYLARRDAEWMGQVHRFLGLSVGLIQQDMTPDDRQRNYACDITYATNSELGFDYLRDNMANSMQEVVQRPFNYCVIDEVDSVLIDEARTPLIISGPLDRPAEKYKGASKIAKDLIRDEHYEVDEKQRNVLMTDEGFIEAERALGVTDLFDPTDPWAHYVFNAIKAKELFLTDVNYIVIDGEVVIVDESSGRRMPGRRWSDGLHQAIEAKENVEIQNETQTLASITYQNFFLIYPKLGGMTGTAKTEEAEFGKIYNLEVTTIPTNQTISRKDVSDVVYKTEDAKWTAIADECAAMNTNTARPVLVGTTSVSKSEVLSRLLSERNIPHNLLNAKPENVERESEIVAQAGRKGQVTIATNMAGRGTDIILGGNSDYMARLKLREYLMPRLVRPEDDETMFESATTLMPFQGDRPPAQGFGGKVRKIKTWNASPEIYPTPLSESAETTIREAVSAAIVQYGEQSLSELDAEDKIATAAEKAPTEDPAIQKLRAAYRTIRKEYDVFTDAEHEEVVRDGGLHVIGTERHESRRIDNQLRGRAGRQGDPGTTKFFLSLQDNLLRIFGGDRVAGLMNAFRVEEDMPIESGMLTKSLENAQRKVETYYYDIRKQVFEYDEVMNNQRKAIYAVRRRVLEQQDLRELVIEYAERTMDDVVEAYIDPDLPSEEWDLAKLVSKVQQFVYLLADLTLGQLSNLSLPEVKEFMHEQVRTAYDMKEAEIEQLQPGLMRQVERYFILQRIDTLWREHLQSMEGLRETVGLRGYGQKDPLIEYKSEGYEIFLDMMVNIRRDVVYAIFQFSPQSQTEEENDLSTVA